METAKLVFAPSVSADVVSYRIAWIDANGVTGEMTVPVGEMVTNGEGNFEVTLNDIVPALDGVYSFDITAMDEANNISPASTITDVAVDFLAPAAPGPITLVVL